MLHSVVIEIGKLTSTRTKRDGYISRFVLVEIATEILPQAISKWHFGATGVSTTDTLPINLLPLVLITSARAAAPIMQDTL